MKVEVGYAFYPPFWKWAGARNRGGDACLELVVASWSHHDRCVTSPDNLASQHVLERSPGVRTRLNARGARSSLVSDALSAAGEAAHDHAGRLDPVDPATLFPACQCP